MKKTDDKSKTATKTKGAGKVGTGLTGPGLLTPAELDKVSGAASVTAVGRRCHTTGQGG